MAENRELPSLSIDKLNSSEVILAIKIDTINGHISKRLLLKFDSVVKFGGDLATVGHWFDPCS